MNRKFRKLITAGLTTLALAGAGVSAQAAESGSDHAFDQMLGTMAARDTGSTWFDSYVDMVNQQIAFIQNTEAYGAAGPSGPLDGFNGYVSGFRGSDTGSRMFNNYVDAVNRAVQSKQEAY